MTKKNPKTEEQGSGKKLWRSLFGITAVLSGGWLILYAILRRFGLLLNTLQWSFRPGNAASIGIIGGADGPTAIFVTGSTGFAPDWDVVLVLLIFIGSIFACLQLRKQN